MLWLRLRPTVPELQDIAGHRKESAVIDDFRFKHRMPTRAAAVRELLKFGLAAVGIDAKVRDRILKDTYRERVVRVCRQTSIPSYLTRDLPTH